MTITGESLPDAEQGSAWLKQMMETGGQGADQVRAATRIVNRALSALRAAARDPLVQDIGATRALAVRLGHGTGDELEDLGDRAARLDLTAGECGGDVHLAEPEAVGGIGLH
ncbi:MAG: hypothetical protein WBQ41_16075, partial [Solirubrobacterales bacterium]